MKPDDAIEILKNMKWSITTKFNAINNSTKALDLAISALEKQEPMTPMAPELDHLGGVTHPCGNCGGELVSKLHDFCPWCGQAVNWEK